MGEAAGEVTRWEDRPDGGLDTDLTGTASATPTGDPEVDQLVVEIEETRVEMTGTVEEIGDRLDPKNIVAGAKETVRDATVGKVEQMANTAGEMVSNAGQTAQEAGSGVVETIRQNPLPAAMVGIGLGWLVNSARSKQSGKYRSFTEQRAYGTTGTVQYGGGTGQYAGSWDTGAMGTGGYGTTGSYGGPDYSSTTYQAGGSSGQGVGQKVGDAAGQVGQTVGQVGQTVGQTVGQVGQTVGQTASQVGQTAGEVVGNVQQTAGQVAEQVGQSAQQGAQQVQYTARQVADNAGRMFQQNPLGMGVIAVAAGTVLGLALPATRKEREILGETRDKVVERVETTASEALSQAEDQARQG
jgi:ElaB/YqjD/DUF883 family membrane-anchored ribosome-binding protein